MRKIDILKNLRDQEMEWRIEPTARMTLKRRKYYSYYNTGIDLILNRIRDSKEAPETVVEDFVSRMYRYLKLCPHNQDLYVACIDAGDHILDLLNMLH